MLLRLMSSVIIYAQGSNSAEQRNHYGISMASAKTVANNITDAKKRHGNSVVALGVTGAALGCAGSMA
ncbi:hypothetical protein [Carnimonas bestiolae]|uniref:hypothetical protein n=1 Tax=Carnimonas bestiolae TaxID=3402172 RepID=UPI003EDC15F3